MSPGLRRFRVTSPIDQQRLSFCNLNPAAKRTIFFRHPTLSMLRRHATISKILLPLRKYVHFYSGRSLALHHFETIFDRFGAGFMTNELACTSDATSPRRDRCRHQEAVFCVWANVSYEKSIPSGAEICCFMTIRSPSNRISMSNDFQVLI